MENEKATVRRDTSVIRMAAAELEEHGVWARVGKGLPMPPYFVALYGYERSIRGSDIMTAARHALQQHWIIDNPTCRIGQPGEESK